MKRPLVLVAAACLLVLMAAAGWTYFQQVRPAQARVAALKAQLASLQAQQQQKLFQSQLFQARRQLLAREIARLSLFDLRNATNPTSALSFRTNLSLIALTQIFTKHDIALQQLTPTEAPAATASAPAQQPSTPLFGGNPNASQAAAPVFQKVGFQFEAAGLYPDLVGAFEGLRELPPTIQVNGYDVRYLDRSGDHARMRATLDLSLDFLGSAGQAVQQDLSSPGLSLEAVPAAASGSVSALPAAAVHVAEAVLGPVLAWCCPAADAAPLHADRMRGRVLALRRIADTIRIDGEGQLSYQVEGWMGDRWIVDLPGVRVGKTLSLRVGRGDPVGTVRMGQYRAGLARVVLEAHPGVHLFVRKEGASLLIGWGPAPPRPNRPADHPDRSHVILTLKAPKPPRGSTARRIRRRLGKQAADIAYKGDPELPGGGDVQLAFGLGSAGTAGVVFGRAEPFLPLGAAAEEAPAPAGDTDGLVAPPALPDASGSLLLRGIMLGEGTPIALFDIGGGSLVRLHPGQPLPSGGRVLAIGTDYVLVSSPNGGARRLSLTRDDTGSRSAHGQLPAAPLIRR